MIKAIALMSLGLAVLPQIQPKIVNVEKPATPGTVYVQLEKAVDGSYVLEQSADARYKELKAKLDENFKQMFALKTALEKQQAITSAKWDEYYALRNEYEKQLKKIVADWVMSMQYDVK